MTRPVRQKVLTPSALMAILTEAIYDAKDGNATAAATNAVANAAGKYLATIRTQMEYAKATGRKPFVSVMEDGTV